MTAAAVDPHEADGSVRPDAGPSVEDRTAQLERLRRVLEGVLGIPATEGNELTLLRNGDEIFPAMLDAIWHARRSVDLLTFIYWKGDIGVRFAAAVCDRAVRGVRVRVLLDAYGSIPIDRSLVERMVSCGVQVEWFRPLRRFGPGRLDHRTHRKVLVVDEEVAFTGGVGIADQWTGDARSEHEWRDTHVRVRGPAVDGLRAAFLDNWVETRDEILEPGVDRFPEQPQPGRSVVQCVRGASEVGQSDMATLMKVLLQLAQHRVRITTAYFVPDADLIARMCDVADRGVRIQVLLPGPHADKRFVQLASEATYTELLDHGVELWNFQPSMLHAKTMTVDGLVATIGSANMNRRSMDHDEEVDLVVLDPGVVDQLDADFEEDLARSVRIDRGRWEHRPVRQRAFEGATALVRRWF